MADKNNNLRKGRSEGVNKNRNKSTMGRIDAVWRRLGGIDAMTQWARENPTEFYTKLYAKLIPVELRGTGENGEHLIKAISDTPLTDDEWINKFGAVIEHDDSEQDLLEPATGSTNRTDSLPN